MKNTDLMNYDGMVRMMAILKRDLAGKELGTGTKAGLSKLYTALGTNTDGSVTQAALKSIIDEITVDSDRKVTYVTFSGTTGSVAASKASADVIGLINSGNVVLYKDTRMGDIYIPIKVPSSSSEAITALNITQGTVLNTVNTLSHSGTALTFRTEKAITDGYLSSTGKAKANNGSSKIGHKDTIDGTAVTDVYAALFALKDFAQKAYDKGDNSIRYTDFVSADYSANVTVDKTSVNNADVIRTSTDLMLYRNTDTGDIFFPVSIDNDTSSIRLVGVSLGRLVFLKHYDTTLSKDSIITPADAGKLAGKGAAAVDNGANHIGYQGIVDKSAVTTVYAALQKLTTQVNRVEASVGAVTSIKFNKVASFSALPTTSADTAGVIYLVPSSKPDTAGKQSFSEYIDTATVHNASTAPVWEMLGTLDNVDLGISSITNDQIDTAWTTTPPLA